MEYFERLRLIRLEVKKLLTEIAPTGVTATQIGKQCRAVSASNAVNEIKGVLSTLVKEESVKTQESPTGRKYYWVQGVMSNEEHAILTAGLQSIGVKVDPPPADEPEAEAGQGSDLPAEGTKRREMLDYIGKHAPVTVPDLADVFGKGTDNHFSVLQDKGLVEKAGMSEPTDRRRRCVLWKLKGQVIEVSGSAQHEDPSEQAGPKIDRLFAYIEAHGPVATPKLIEEFGNSAYTLLYKLRDRGRISQKTSESPEHRNGTKVWSVGAPRSQQEAKQAEPSPPITSEPEIEARPAHVEPDMLFQLDEGELMSEEEFNRKVSQFRAAGIADAIEGRAEEGKTIPLAWAKELKRRMAGLIE